MSSLRGFLKFAGTVKIRGFDTFWRCKSREVEYRVSYGSTLNYTLIRVYTDRVKG
jgi:hypothetical protein